MNLNLILCVCVRDYCFLYIILKKKKKENLCLTKETRYSPIFLTKVLQF